jgi:N-acetylglucosaminyl-diphospho-decaprenol L-rhamnosyltransferase
MPAHGITLSIVSHKQNALALLLLNDVARYCAPDVAIVLTENVADAVSLETGNWPNPLTLIRNERVKGFAANHNAAFQHCSSAYFCVANPDVRLTGDPFPLLVESLARDEASVAGPLVRNPTGVIEDSARHFPNIGSLLKKAIREPTGPDYPTDRGPLEVDWIAGMFMMFDSESYRRIGGFDEGYFLYYEDVDICRRLHNAGRSVIYDPRAAIVHDARRGSRRSARLALHHAASVYRFLSRGG